MFTSKPLSPAAALLPGLFFLLCLALPAAAQQPLQPFAEAMASQRIQCKVKSSLMVAIVQGQQTHISGYNSAAGQVPNEYSLYTLGGLTTLFTAGVLAAQQVQANIGIDNPLQNHLPDSVRVPVYREIECTTQPGNENYPLDHIDGDPTFLQTVCTYNESLPPTCITLCQLTSYGGAARLAAAKAFKRYQQGKPLP